MQVLDLSRVYFIIKKIHVTFLQAGKYSLSKYYINIYMYRVGLTLTVKLIFK